MPEQELITLNEQTSLAITFVVQPENSINRTERPRISMTRIIYTIENYDLLTCKEMDEGMDYQIGIY